MANDDEEQYRRAKAALSWLGASGEGDRVRASPENKRSSALNRGIIFSIAVGFILNVGGVILAVFTQDATAIVLAGAVFLALGVYADVSS